VCAVRQVRRWQPAADFSAQRRGSGTAAFLRMAARAAGRHVPQFVGRTAAVSLNRGSVP